ncbi:MAG: cytochrome c biogenesis protein CcdA [Firmicutes bacterium]|nr:cytochrome c biogenesis protein CcdA [Bacillota bacterium]
MDWLEIADSSLASHGLVFLGGLLSGLSPCTIPTIVLVVAYVGGYARGRLRALWLSVGFVLGLCLTMAGLGYAVAATGGLLRDYSLVTGVAAGVCLVMGLNLLGVVDLRLPGAALPSAARRGWVGAFLLGVPFAFVASPCTTPVTIAVLALAATKGVPVWGATFLFAYALGRSVPLLVAGTLAGSAATLTMNETWSERIRKASGVVLLGLGGYLVWTALG